jgi:hypothetical protein
MKLYGNKKIPTLLRMGGLIIFITYLIKLRKGAGGWFCVKKFFRNNNLTTQ